MLYKVLFEKEKTYWWDEDHLGSTEFAAASDEEAVQIVFTIAIRMDVMYWRAHEPRGVYVRRLERLDSETGERIPVSLQDGVPLSGFAAIRKAMGFFYPLIHRDGRLYHDSVMPAFSGWRCHQHPSTKRRLAVA